MKNQSRLFILVSTVMISENDNTISNTQFYESNLLNSKISCLTKYSRINLKQISLTTNPEKKSYLKIGLFKQKSFQ